MLIFFVFDSLSSKEKFELLYQQYKRLLLKKAYEILMDYSLAEDAVSEAYIRVYKNLHKIDDPDSNRTAAFLVTVTKNVALSMRRKERVMFFEELGEDIQEQSDFEDKITSALTLERIYEIVNGLSDELRDAFLLKYAHDLSHKEIGKIMGISENNATVRIHRAKKKLAELVRMEGLCNE